MGTENIDWSQVINWIISFISGGIGGAIVGAIFQHYSNKGLVKYNLVNESQFRAFSELWKSLTDLKSKADDLWENANDIKLLSFVLSLKEADKNLEANAIILNEEEYKSLRDIINKFSDYQFGKTRLIDMDKGKIKAERKEFTLTNGARGIYDERISQISQNEDIKNEYEKLLGELRIKFQDKMGIK